MTETKQKPKAVKDWQCQECGHKTTLKGAERAMNGDSGCPGCGGSDFDLARPSRVEYGLSAMDENR